MNTSLLTRTLTVGGLALVLLVPVSMIRDLIAERQARRDAAVAGIALGWGARQTLAGPYLAVPAERRWTEVIRETVDGVARERRIERREVRVLRLPADSLDWSIRAATLEKSRGIHRARLYNATVSARGTFTLPAHFGIPSGAKHWQFGLPRLVLGVSDPRGIRVAGPLEIEGKMVEFAPGAGDPALAAGLHAPLALLADSAPRAFAFGFTLELAGAEMLALAPLARDTTVALGADWPHPSFQGVFLPKRHALRADGFDARWRISRHAAQGAERLAACGAASPCPALQAQTLQVSFIEPVGVYQQLERASKYGFLFVGLSFAAVFLHELARRLAIHPVQYGLVGLALAVFFLLLTALSEHLAFALAYAIAASACAGLVAAYLVRVLDSRAAGLGFGAGLGLLYGALYLLLRAEDYALLGGAVLVFGLLAAAMVATRPLTPPASPRTPSTAPRS